MSRKILKVLISILFLIVAAVAAILSIKSFFPELLDEHPKYGVTPEQKISARKTPAFKKDNKDNKVPLQDPFAAGRKYGVASVEKVNALEHVAIPAYREDMTDKYGVAPVRRPPYREQGEKYGVSSIRKLKQEKLLKNQKKNVSDLEIAEGYTAQDLERLREKAKLEDNMAKYGVAPIKNPSVTDLSQDIDELGE